VTKIDIRTTNNCCEEHFDYEDNHVARLGASVLLTVSLIGQDAPIPQDIPLQKPKMFRDRGKQEYLIRMGREPFKMVHNLIQ